MTHVAVQGHDALLLWTQLAVLLVAARALGALARRLGQPAVVGSLLAGLLLGPSVFGQLWPRGFRWFLPAAGAEPRLLFAVASMSLMVLLIVLGAETDLPLIRSLGRAAAAVSAGSILVPLAAAILAARLVPAALHGAHPDMAPFVGLLSAALAVSSLPVVARIVTELEVARRNFGQLALAAATVNDAFGFIALAVAAALVHGGGFGLLLPFAGLAGLLLLVAFVAQPVIDALLRVVRRNGPNITGSFAVSFAAAFALAAAAQAMNIDAAFGAFLAGVALGRSRFQQSQALEVLESVTSALFAPLYFATAGLQVDLSTLHRAGPAIALAVLLVLAATTKYAGSVLGGLAAGLPLREGSALGVLLNGRGAMQVIIGSAGLALGVFSTATYTIVIVISLLTSVAVPPLLRETVRGWRGSAEEQERLDLEEELETNVAVRGQRLLLPSRGNPNSFAAAQVLDSAWPPSSELTVLSITEEGEPPPDLGALATPPSGRQVRQRHLQAPDVLEQVLAEAQLGYGVIGVGAVENPSAESLLPPVIEELLNFSPIPVLVVRRPRRSPPPRAGRRRILTPVAGSSASRAGQEVAHNISRNTGAEVILAHVLTRPEAGEGALAAVLADAQAVAEDHEVPVRTMPRHGASAGEELTAAAAECGADTVVVGATVRRIAGRPFLGHTVEHLLAHVEDATVVVVVLPEVAVTDIEAGQADRTAR